MQFNSLIFLGFLAVVLLLHNLSVPWRLKKFNLLWLSYVFYAAWNPPFVVLLWISTVVDWYIGRKLHVTESKSGRRGLLVLSLVVNLGMLSYFKYGQFLMDNWAALLGTAGITWEPPPFDIVLPIGISFYTFQTLSYTIDIFQRRAKPWHSFLDYALFVTFFPQLVAGPIVRARQFLPQCAKQVKVSGDQFAWGLCLFVIGVFEKVVLADALLAPAVEKVFDSDVPPTALDSWIASYGFMTQMFFDFSGYSLCAIGIGKCLGFKLPDNFRFPLAAVGFAAFWRRWHISLSSWLRDYVYGSLRGSSSERSLRWVFNILVTWGLIGLWHGSAWQFVLWGMAAGCLLVVEGFARGWAPRWAIWSTLPAQLFFAWITLTATWCDPLGVSQLRPRPNGRDGDRDVRVDA